MQLIIRKASVRWSAGQPGERVVTTDSGALRETPFSAPHPRRSESETDSAELIAAALAGSFSLALEQELGGNSLSTGDITVSAAVTLEEMAGSWTIMNIHLNVTARLSKLTQGRFIEATVRAKARCLVSRALRPTVSMNAKLDKLTPHLVPPRTRRKVP